MQFYGLLPLGAQTAQSAPLSSNSILPQQGSFTSANNTVALSGAESALEQGIESPNRSKAPTGAEVLSGTGNLTYVVLSGANVDVFLFGEDIEVDDGTLIADRSKPLSGSESASEQGTEVPGVTPTTLITQLIQPAAGTLVYVPPGSSGDVTVNINAGEMEINSFTGTVKTASPLTTQVSAVEQGSVALGTRSEALTGSSFTAEISSVTVQQDVEDTYIASSIGSVVFTMVTALSGSEVDLDHGTIGTSGDVTAALTTQAVAVEIGSVEDSFELPLTGSEILGEQTDDNFGLPLNIELTGSDLDVETGTVYLDNDRAYPLFGSEVLVEVTNPHMDINAFVNGEFIFTEQQTIGPQEVTLEGIEIAMAQETLLRPKRDHAGKPSKDGKRKKRVMVDGQQFEVDEAELKELLKLTKEIATAKAKEEADAAVAAMVAAKSTEKIRLTVPKVTGSEELKDAIADIYMQATIDAEVSRNRQLDEEEALVLLLLN